MTINSISCLSASIDALNRAGEGAAIAVVVAKLLELIKEL